MSKMSVGSSTNTQAEAREPANDMQDGINLDGSQDASAVRLGSSNMSDLFPNNKGFDTTTPASGDSSDLPRFGSKELPEFEDDEDLNTAVHEKITELEEENKTLNAFLSGRKEVKLPTRLNSAESARGLSSSTSSSDEEAAPPRFADSQAVTSRLTLEKNLATIKSLQLNLLH